MITKIGTKVYNLTKFNHPGGDTALWHVEDRDATGLVAMHHPFTSKNKLEAILKKYEVKTEETEEIFEYDTEFSQELKAEVKTHFNGKSHKATWSRWTQLLLLMTIETICLWFWLTGWWTMIVIKPLITWIAGVNVFHDACHFALSSNPYVNSFFGYLYPSFTSPIAWYHQHNIGHHIYTNIAHRDPDLHHAGPFSRKTEKVPHTFLHKYQLNIVGFEMVFSFVRLAILNTYYYLRDGFYYHEVKTNRRGAWLHFIDRAVYVLFYFILPMYIIGINVKAFIFILSHQMIFSSLFMINTQITHLHSHTMKISTDWYKHQVETSTNHSIGNQWAFLFSGGLNYQIEHHLFPTVNHCHYPNIQPIVERVCRKHGVEYRSFSGFPEAIRSYLRHIKK
jgi:fatty acid desaturase